MKTLQIFWKFVTLSGINLGASAVSFVATILIAKMFGAEGLGRVSLVTSVLAYAVLVSGSGAEAFVVREVAAGRQAVNESFTDLVALRFAAAVPVYGGVVLLALLLENFRPSLDLFVVFGLTLLVVPFRTVWIAQAFQQTHIIGFFNFILEFAYLAGVVILWIFACDIYGLGWARLTAEVAATTAVLYWVFKHYSVSFAGLSVSRLMRLMRCSWHFTAFPLVRGLSLGMDLVILSFFVSDLELGFYAAASKIFFTLVSLSAAYISVIYPWLASVSRYRGQVREEVARLSKVVMPATLAGTSILLLFSDRLLGVIFGPDFESAGVVLQLLSIAFLANLYSRHFRQVLLMSELQDLDLKISTLAMMVHLSLKIFLAATMGIEGVALGTAIGEVALLIIHCFVSTASVARVNN